MDCRLGQPAHMIVTYICMMLYIIKNQKTEFSTRQHEEHCVYYANMSHMYAKAKTKTKGGGSELLELGLIRKPAGVHRSFLGRPTNKDLTTSKKHAHLNTIRTLFPSSTDVAHLPSTTSPFTAVILFCSCGIGSKWKSCFGIAGNN